MLAKLLMTQDFKHTNVMWILQKKIINHKMNSITKISVSILYPPIPRPEFPYLSHSENHFLNNQDIRP